MSALTEQRVREIVREELEDRDARIAARATVEALHDASLGMPPREDRRANRLLALRLSQDGTRTAFDAIQRATALFAFVGGDDTGLRAECLQLAYAWDRSEVEIISAASAYYDFIVGAAAPQAN
jgi:hypothetical protein